MTYMFVTNETINQNQKYGKSFYIPFMENCCRYDDFFKTTDPLYKCSDNPADYNDSEHFVANHQILLGSKMLEFLDKFQNHPKLFWASTYISANFFLGGKEADELGFPLNLHQIVLIRNKHSAFKFQLTFGDHRLYKTF